MADGTSNHPQSSTTTTAAAATSRRVHVVFGSQQPRSLTGVLAAHSAGLTSPSTSVPLPPNHARPQRAEGSSRILPYSATLNRERNRVATTSTSDRGAPTAVPYRGNSAKTMVWPRRMRPPPRSNWDEYSSGSSISSTSSRSIHSSKHSLHSARSHRTGSSTNSREGAREGATDSMPSHRIPAPVLHALHQRRSSNSSRPSSGSSSSRHSHASSHRDGSSALSAAAKGKKPHTSEADNAPKPPQVRATRYIGTPPPGTFATSPDAPSRLLANREPTPVPMLSEGGKRPNREPVDLLASKFLSLDTMP